MPEDPVRSSWENAEKCQWAGKSEVVRKTAQWRATVNGNIVHASKLLGVDFK